MASEFLTNNTKSKKRTEAVIFKFQGKIPKPTSNHAITKFWCNNRDIFKNLRSQNLSPILPSSVSYGRSIVVKQCNKEIERGMTQEKRTQ